MPMAAPTSHVSRIPRTRADGSGWAVTLPARMDSLDKLAGLFQSWLAHAVTDDAARREIALAIHEACVNVIQHAYPTPTDTDAPHTSNGDMRVQLDVTDGRLIATITDWGDGFSFAERAAQITTHPPEPLAENGWGLYIILSTMDDVTYATSRNAHMLMMTKRLPRASLSTKESSYVCKSTH